MQRKDTIKIFILVMVMISCALIGGCQISETPEEILEKVAQLINEKDNETAVSILQPFVYHHQDNYTAHFLMGRAYLNNDADNDRDLYVARYYFKKAQDLAENEMQREKAALMYADVKLLMGKGNQSGEVILETADRAGIMGRKSQAARLCIQAASQFIEANEYKNAQKACQTGLKYADTENQEFDLRLGLATAFFLDSEYLQSHENLKKLPINSNPNCRITSLDKTFLGHAVQLMMLKSKRHKILRWKKEFDKNIKKQFVSNFNSMVNYLEKNRSLLDKKKAKLVAESCQIVAEYSKDNNMLRQARTAYKFAKSYFADADLGDEAMSVAENIADLNS